MLDAAIQMAKENPILLAGIGTLSFGSIMFFIRDVPLRLYGFVKRMLTIEVDLTSDSFLYHEILGVLSNGRIRAFARNYTTDYDGNIVAGYGRSIAMFEGRFVTFTRELIKENLKLSEKLGIIVFSRDVDILRRIIAQARKPKTDQSVKVYHASSGYWEGPIRKRKRPLETVFVNGETKTDVVDKIKWFLANEEWYLKRGIPYKLIFLFHGEPGTGKSSLIYSIASHFDRGVGAISNINFIDQILRNLPENTFGVIEDIDMLSISREDEDDDQERGRPAQAAKSPSGLAAQMQMTALQILINTLDGLATPHGLILFITTNFKERLDHALIRPGRVDGEIEVKRLGPEATEKMFVAFYGDKNQKLVREYVSSKSFRPRTGAELQLLFMTQDAAQALDNLKAGA